jgi:glycosyltransferase involved in cell wall biosynthesis
MDRISVVVVTRNEGAELHRTVENLRDTLPGRSEVIVVDDGSTDGSTGRYRRRIVAKGLGVARARNLGASHARGELLVFADAHIRMEKRWWTALADLTADPKVGAAAPAIAQFGKENGYGYGLRFTGPELDARWLQARPAAPVPVPILPGCCLAIRRKVFDVVKGWDSGLRHRGGTDNELSVRLWLFGYEGVVTPEVSVRHLFRDVSPYPVGWPEYLHNRLRLAFACFSPSRMAKVVRALHRHEAFGEAMELVLASHIGARRRQMTVRRKRTDDEYFERFGMKW